MLCAFRNRGWRETLAIGEGCSSSEVPMFEGSFNMQMGRILEEASHVLQKRNPQLYIELH